MDDLIKEYLFPHEKIRPTQDVFLKEAYTALKNKENILIHAPTGIGKTTIIGAALSYAIKNNLDVFFLTPMHTQHTIAIETIRKIKEKFKLNINAVNIIGKKGMCSQSNVMDLSSTEFSEYCKELKKQDMCEFYLNTYNKKGKKIKPTFAAKLFVEKFKEPLHVDELVEKAKESKLCPYEVSCLIARNSEIVIADYYHVLNPVTRESLFRRINKEIQNSILIFDEAHNVVRRTRSMLSSSISTFTINRAIKEARHFKLPDVEEIISKISDILESLIENKLSLTNNESLIKREEFNDRLLEIDEIPEITDKLEYLSEMVYKEQKKCSSASLASFITSWQNDSNAYTRILKRASTRSNKVFYSLSHTCLDPSLITSPLVSQAYCSIFMSGTLNPIQMHKDLMGINAKLVELKNPFPSKNRLNLIAPIITTKYTKRTEDMFNKIATSCAKICNSVNGNSAIFFPSYSIRNIVYKIFSNICNKTLFLEYQNITKTEKEDMLEKFKRSNSAVLLAVSGGSLGEGVDYFNNILKCVIIAGLPLTRPDLETSELIRYYDQRFGKGWDYAYTYPAIIKTLQNAGRCIRSETDRGIIIFMDERFAWQNYKKLFDKEFEYKITLNPEEEVKEFWK